MRCAKRLLAAVLAFSCSAYAEEESAVRRYLADLYLGDRLETIQSIYPPRAGRDWPAHVEPKGGVKRIRVDRSAARKFPADADRMWLGFKNDRLVEVQIIFNEDYSRERPAEELAAEFALDYGQPRRSQNRFWWDDGSTVLRVMVVEYPVLGPDGGRRVELRTGLQIMESDLFNRKY